MQSKVWSNMNNINLMKKSLLKNQIPITSFTNRINEIKDEAHGLRNYDVFNSISNLDDHDSEDDDLTTPWICWPCGRVCQFKCLLFKHQLHCNASYKRKQTVQKQRRKILLKKKLLSLKQEFISCSMCHEKFTSKLQYNLHRQQGSCSKKRFSCIKCREKFKSFQDLRIHDCLTSESTNVLSSSITHKHSKVFSCKCCESTFNLQESLKTHLLENSECSEMHHLHVKMEYKKRQLKSKRSLTARKSFSKKVSKPNEKSVSPLLNMYNTSIDRSPAPVSGSARKSISNSSYKIKENHLCDVCGKRFSLLSDLKVHKENHSQSRTKEIFSQCPECQESFSSSHDLIQHQADFDHYSQGPKPLSFSCSCPFCDKKFLHIQNRNAHLRYHTEKTSSEIKEYVRKTTCGVCFRTFGTESTKEEHIRAAHIQMAISSPMEKNFEPSSKTLQNSQSNDDTPKLVVLSQVSDDVLKQLQNSPRVCPLCCRTYDSNANRNRHFRLHVMGASCECEICFSKFPRTNYLETHMKNEHKNTVVYNCKQCGISFFTRIAILQHVMKNHPMYPMTDLIVEKASNSNILNLNSMQLKNETTSVSSAVKEQYHCNICNLKFMKLCGLRRHENSKVHAKVEKIYQVRKEKIRNLQLQLPPRALTPPFVDYSNPITCSECVTEFPNVQKFVPHRLSHFNGEDETLLTDENCPYTCEVCGKLLNNQQKIQVHLIWHLQDVQTQFSSKSFTARKSLPSAKNSTSPVPVKYSVSSSKNVTGGAVAKKSFKSNSYQLKSPLTCKQCSVNFTTKYDYLCHIKQAHTNTGQNISEDSNTNDNFTTNYQKPSNTKSYCVTCGCFFSTSTLFNEHKTLFCTPGFKARIDENFINKNLHVLTNSMKTDVTIISCIQCCVMFASIEMLAKHMERHKVTVTNGSLSLSTEASNDSNSDYVSSNNYMGKLSPNDNEDSQLCKITNINTIDPNLFAMEHSGDSNNLHSDEDVFNEDMNYNENNALELTKLRQNFSHLLSALVSDADLMKGLGFGERLIDDVLVNVLEKMALTPVDESDNVLSDLDKFRCNIRTLLDVCLNDQIMELITDNEITTDKIVISALKMFGINPE